MSDVVYYIWEEKALYLAQPNDKCKKNGLQAMNISPVKIVNSSEINLNMDTSTTISTKSTVR